MSNLGGEQIPYPPLEVQPNELCFTPPFNRTIQNVVKLRNQTKTKTIAYKVKTTAPKRYCVRPSTGIVPPNQMAEVQVLLNFTKDRNNKPVDFETPDKFLVQSVVLDSSIVEDANFDVKEIWNNVKKEDIVKQRLKCTFTSKHPSEEEEPSFVPTITDSENEFSESNAPHETDTSIPSIPETTIEDTQARLKNMLKENEQLRHQIFMLNKQMTTVTKERDGYKENVKNLKAQQTIYDGRESSLRKRSGEQAQLKEKPLSTSQMTANKEQQMFTLIIPYIIIAIIFFLLGHYFS